MIVYWPVGRNTGRLPSWQFVARRNCQSAVFLQRRMKMFGCRSAAKLGKRPIRELQAGYCDLYVLYSVC
jgi:hypothetical protein